MPVKVCEFVQLNIVSLKALLISVVVLLNKFVVLEELAEPVGHFLGITSVLLLAICIFSSASAPIAGIASRPQLSAAKLGGAQAGCCWGAMPVE